MQKDSEGIMFRLKLSQYVVQWLGIQEWACGDSGTKDLQKQIEFQWDIEKLWIYWWFHLTSAKVKELLSMVRTFLYWETNQIPALN